MTSRSAESGLAPETGARPPVLVTGEQYELTAGDYRAVVTGLGAGLRELSYAGEPVVYGYPPDELPPGAAGQLLAPWPNRVDHGRYEFDGASYQLDLSEPKNSNAIHGLTRWAASEPVRQEADRVLLTHLPHGYTGYPFSVEVGTEYRLSAAGGLQVTVSATNRGTRPAPYGTGQHPYFTAGPAPLEEWQLELPASRLLPVDERGIPSGPEQDIDGTVCDFREPHAIGTTVLDHALTGLSRAADGRVWAHVRSAGRQVSVWAGDGYGWLQVFTSDTLPGERHRKAIAIEPMTCPPNAFVSGDDLIVLAPGESVSHTWGVEARAA
ncbi:MAG TPA: aldose 1-epimerase family protein [Streptosporangiaceae bacterium]|nr:aldose 1-epimerase family protein [Streptosporangiaceae bacterium]